MKLTISTCACIVLTVRIRFYFGLFYGLHRQKRKFTGQKFRKGCVKMSTEITTTIAHGFDLGDTVVISGLSGEMAKFNGSHIIVEDNGFTFTIKRSNYILWSALICVVSFLTPIFIAFWR